jgi:hypothetical protein
VCVLLARVGVCEGCWSLGGGGEAVEIAVLKPHLKSTLNYSLAGEGCVARSPSHVTGQTVGFISRNLVSSPLCCKCKVQEIDLMHIPVVVFQIHDKYFSVYIICILTYDHVHH